MCEKQDSDIPQYGFSREPIHFILLINSEGKLLQIPGLRTLNGKKIIPAYLVVPEREIRTGRKKSANFLWDNSTYVLGYDEENMDKASKSFAEFKKHNHEIGDAIEDTAMKAVLMFLDNFKLDDVKKLGNLDEISGSNFVFQLDGDMGFVHEREEIRNAWINYKEITGSSIKRMCLVTGDKKSIARLHPAIKGVKGAQQKGAAIISFNLSAFTSYNKEQNFNAPVGELSAFAYTTALNDLLKYESRQKVQIGDTATVFWTERESPVEGYFGMVLNPGKDESETSEVRRYLEAVKKGYHPENIDPDVKFFILGLSPNASRLAVRFWLASTTGEIGEKIGQHYRDLAIVKEHDYEPDYPPIWQLMLETASQRKRENIPPLITGVFMQSVLTGSLYPQGLLSLLIQRMHAENNINYFRASLIKAILARKQRIHKSIGMEVNMSLNTESTNTAYRLGRLFAVLEQAQRKAIPGAGSTIKDRYFGAASATPRSAFPNLIRLTQHHIAKMEYHYADKLIESILSEIDEFPAHLTLEEQGLFALGYYHQRKDIFTKKNETIKEDN